MTEREENVHKNHCCILHGCKYGDGNCPVVSGEIKQKYKCEQCHGDDFFLEEDSQDRINEKFTVSNRKFKISRLNGLK